MTEDNVKPRAEALIEEGEKVLKECRDFLTPELASQIQSIIRQLKLFVEIGIDPKDSRFGEVLSKIQEYKEESDRCQAKRQRLFDRQKTVLYALSLLLGLVLAVPAMPEDMFSEFSLLTLLIVASPFVLAEVVVRGFSSFVKGFIDHRLT